MYKFYEVDPEADTLLIIPYPPKTFAPWQPVNTTQPCPTADASVYAGILRGTSRPPNIYASIASSPEVRIKVSSKHLSLVSKHFRNKFRHLDQGSTEADGRIHITLAGYDPAAVIIVMDIIHGRGRKVPRAIDLETLAKVAVFVDAFRCFEAVEAYAERWFENLGTSVATEYGRDLVLWLYASYTFRQSEAFKKATRSAVLQSDGPIRSLGLQVREGVIKEIDTRRQQLVSKSLDAVHDTVSALQDNKASCHLGCDTFLLGALIKTLHRNQLIWPRPTKPLVGVSFGSIEEAVSEAQAQMAHFIPSLSLSSPRRNTASSRKRRSPNAQPGQALTPESSPEMLGTVDAHECGAKSDLLQRLEELEAGVEGLDLESRHGYYLY